MKINLRLAEFYLLLLASLTLGLFVLLFAPREGGVSETENRRLQPFPAMTAEGVFSGEYMEQFESFLSDAFPARESMIRLSGAIMDLFGKADANAEARRTFDVELGMIGDEAPAAVQAVPEAVAQPQAEDAPTPESVSPAIFWVRHRNGAGEIIESYDAATVAHLAGVLNRYRAALGEEGRVFFINSPASDVANELYDTHQYIDWGCDLDEAIAPWLDEGVHLYSVPKLLQCSSPGRTRASPCSPAATCTGMSKQPGGCPTPSSGIWATPPAAFMTIPTTCATASAAGLTAPSSCRA